MNNRKAAYYILLGVAVYGVSIGNYVLSATTFAGSLLLSAKK